MHCVIIGGEGFIGKALIRQIPKNYKITIVDSLEPQVHGKDAQFSHESMKRATCIKADVRETEMYNEILETADCIVHLASQTGTGQSMYQISRYIQHNVDGTAKLLEAIAGTKRKPHKIILASSRAVYGEGAYQDSLGNVVVPKGRCIDQLKTGKWELYDKKGYKLKPIKSKETHDCRPTSIYGMTKLWQEQLVSSFSIYNHINLDIFRIQNAYGEGQSLLNPYTGIVGIFTTMISNNDCVDIYEDGKVTRDFVHVDDVAYIFGKAIVHSSSGNRVLNIGSGISTNLLGLAELIAKILHKKIKIQISGKYRYGDIRHAGADLTNLLFQFPEYNPITLFEGLQRYIDWFNTQTNHKSDFLQEAPQEFGIKNCFKSL